MKTIKEMIEVMQAYERGDKIETCISGEQKKWFDNKNPACNWEKCDYRVKPKKKYVPFDTAEEFLAAQRVHGININHIGASSKFLCFVGCDNKVIIMDTLYKYKVNVDFRLLCDFYTFADGTPCGKEVKSCQI